MNAKSGKKTRRLFGAWLSVAGVLIIVSVAWAQDTRREQREAAKNQELEAFVAKLQKYQGDVKGLDDIGSLTGLWRMKSGVREGQSPIRQIYHLRDAMSYSYVDTATGKLSLTGFATQKDGAWRGWWSLGCLDCCPGVGWWDRGAFTTQTGGAKVQIRSLKMEPQQCVLTDTPDDITLDLELVRALSFREYLPGKLIHIVAAPAVGNQGAQYKAAVRPQWDLQGLGVARFTLAVKPGGALIKDSTQLKGDYEFVTSHAGKYFFIIMAENQEGKLLHLDIKSIEIPAIPGIN
jgi:hypothetical protein